jgi:hypothetical protein
MGEIEFREWNQPWMFAFSYRHESQRAHHRRLQHRWWLLSDLPPAPQGGRRRCLQHQWWPLPEILITAPRGPPSTSSASVVVAARPAARTPQGARRRCLQHRWWPLPEIPTAAHRGLTIDVSSFGGGRCRTRTCRQHPRGPAINVFNIGGGRCRKS